VSAERPSRPPVRPFGPAHAARGLRDLPVLAYGFRPFFLMASIFAALAAPLWLLVLSGALALAAPLPPTLWHGHEMLIGYGAAVLAGFLLTASPGWSGTAPIRGWLLGGLALLWLAGRIACSLGGAMPALAAATDLAFLPALAVALTPALQAAGRRNLVFLPLLGALFLANLVMHLDAQDVLPGAGTAALRAALDLFVLLIALVGGRVVPAFTANALRARGEEPGLRPFGTLDQLALGALVAMLLADAAELGRLAGGIAALAALLNGLRMRGWASGRTLGQPLLWALHLGYAWLVAGLAWKGLVDLTGLLAPSESLHGLAIGAVGTMTLAVMSRAALGHTGRPLVAPRLMTVSYLLIGGAGLARLAAPLVPGDLHLLSLILSATLWSLAFLAFVVTFARPLTRPRIDGRPG
jgi:uncharacterized protein involved in response to NO